MRIGKQYLYPLFTKLHLLVQIKMYSNLISYQQYSLNNLLGVSKRLLFFFFLQCLEELQFCSTCECTEEDGDIKCYRRDQKIGGCPKTCGEPCLCTRSNPPTCWCTYEVDTCSASSCSVGTATKLVNVLGLINGNQ